MSLRIWIFNDKSHGSSHNSTESYPRYYGRVYLRNRCYLRGDPRMDHQVERRLTERISLTYGLKISFSLLNSRSSSEPPLRRNGCPTRGEFVETSGETNNIHSTISNSINATQDLGVVGRPGTLHRRCLLPDQPNTRLLFMHEERRIGHRSQSSPSSQRLLSVRIS